MPVYKGTKYYVPSTPIRPHRSRPHGPNGPGTTTRKIPKPLEALAAARRARATAAPLRTAA